MHALGGDNRYTKDDYYLQVHGTTMVALHVPSRKVSDLKDAGHALEHLLTGSGAKHSMYFASTLARIGKWRVLISSEIDAKGVEIKSSKVSKEGGLAITPKIALQVACNGSDHILC
eukprot:5188787-Amphidinium_carterae.1